ncbi:uncharacterized protein LOC132558323 [Ylistrum balloti]|uniref:uncharacterized protein LOC132558323 n=1 Tax=Ylistrum balloti TaxID=509963 RepID=UPI002905A08C|nr:uncharacterized protein LOC132558323 [Ylistrum balloti]
MSRVTGEKLTRDNPDVTDLSDPKRPNKLGDEYSELYDNEWTDAMEILTETTEAKDSDRRGIDILLNILQRTHESCITIADNQMKNLQTAVMLETSAENVNQRLESLKEKFGDFPLDKLVPFVNKCTEICWAMVMQSPRMEFLFPTEVHGVKFNKNHFKQFVHSGETLDFVVWPALATHKNGPLLVKGVVQPNAK